MFELSPGRVVGGKYRLENLLGRGGMGSVWLAQHLQLDAPVAVKFMDAAFASADGARRRFEREAKAAAQLRSPHVVQVHDHGVEGMLPYIVMELLEGEDLGARLKRERRLSAAALAPIVAQVCKALQRAHDAGIVHRDLKPGNVFLATDGDDEIVKVLDFGVAKMTLSGDGEETASGALLGSAHYMSPEQARGDKRVDHRSDLWSLGVILFRALTGKKPFHGSMGEAIISICTRTVSPPSQVAPDLGPEVDRFFERALSRDPEGRFQTVREMAAAFEVLAASAPAVPRGLAPAGPPESPDVDSTSSMTNEDAVTRSMESAASGRDRRSGESSGQDVTAPPFLASVPSPPPSSPGVPGPRPERSAGESLAPFRRRSALAWWAGGSAILTVVVAVVALARAGRAPDVASRDAAVSVAATGGGDTAIPASAAPPSAAPSEPVARSEPEAPAPAETTTPESKAALPPGSAHPSKPGKGTGAAPAKKPRRGANDEPNFGY